MMVQLSPKTIEEIGLKPSPSGAWVCCKVKDSYALTDLIVIISATEVCADQYGVPSYDWDIVEVYASRPKAGTFHESEYEQLTGAAFEDARSWLLEHEYDLLETHVLHDYQEAENGAYADHKMARAAL